MRGARVIAFGGYGGVPRAVRPATGASDAGGGTSGAAAGACQAWALPAAGGAVGPAAGAASSSCTHWCFALGSDICVAQGGLSLNREHWGARCRYEEC